MTVTPFGRAALLCALAVTGAAQAQTVAQTSAPVAPSAARPALVPAPNKPAPSSAPKPAPAPSASPAASPAAAPAVSPAAKPAAPAPASSAGMSESKYLALLYAEIAKHTPEENAAGPGEVTASFIIGPAGKVTKVTIDKTSSPAHAEVVKKILGEVAAPPPPGGSMDVGQTFKFR